MKNRVDSKQLVVHRNTNFRRRVGDSFYPNSVKYAAATLSFVDRRCAVTCHWRIVVCGVVCAVTCHWSLVVCSDLLRSALASLRVPLTFRCDVVGNVRMNIRAK